MGSLTAVLLLGASAVAVAQPAQVVTVSGNIHADATWSPSDARVYLVDGEVELAEGVTLRIEPGTLVKFQARAALRVLGSLQAVGSAAQPIRFTSAKDDNIGGDLYGEGPSIPSRTDWGGIQFGGASGSASQLSHCEIWFGGGSVLGGLVGCDGASPTLLNCRLAAGTYGVTCTAGASPRIQDTTIDDCASAPLALSLDAQPTFDALVFGSERDNGLDAIGILGNRLETSATLGIRSTQIGTVSIANVPYVLLQSVVVERDVTLTIDPGVLVKAMPGARLQIDGQIEALGRVAAPIVFTSVADDGFGEPSDTNRDASMSAPSAGDWGGIAFADSSVGTLERCVLRYGGAAGIVETGVGVHVRVQDCLLAEGITGVYQHASADVSVLGTTVRGCADAPIVLALPDRMTLSGLTFTGNGITALGLSGAPVLEPAVLSRRNVAGYVGITYFVSQPIQVQAALAIEPGITVKFASAGAGLDLRGGLQALGNGLQPIVFTSVHDDCAGEPRDTATDGWSHGPCYGDWGSLHFPWGVGEESLLRWCIFRFGGAGCRGVVAAEGPGPTLEDCLFEFNAVGFSTHGNGLPLAPKLTPEQANVFRWNGIPALVHIGGTLARDATLSASVLGGQLKALVVLDRDLRVPFDVTLTIASGTRIVAIGAGIIVQGALIADFTPADRDSSGIWGPSGYPGGTTGSGGPIFGDGCEFVPGCDLEGYDPFACFLGKRIDGAQWKGIRFEHASDDRVSLLRNFAIRGAERGVVIQNSSPVLTNVLVEDSVHEGIWVEGRSRPIIERCEITGSGSTPLALSLTSDPVLTDSDFHDNALAALGVVGETLSRDTVWAPRSIADGVEPPFAVLEDLVVAPGVTLDVQPGVIAKFLPGKSITVHHALRAIGTAARGQQIVFTSIADDFHGGRSPSAGTDPRLLENRWGGIRCSPVSMLGDSRFEQCVFRFAGTPEANAAVAMSGASHASFAHCTFAHNGTGIEARDVAESPGVAQIVGCDFFGNEAWAVHSTSTNVLFAEQNWWGAGSGPLDESDDRFRGGFYNPGGDGDAVSDGVDYDPWLTEGPDHGILGDVSYNGDIQAFDASLVLRHLVGDITLAPLAESLADVTCSGGVTALDAAEILRLVAGATTFFPCTASVPLQDLAGGCTLTLRPRSDARDEWSLEWSGPTPLRAAQFELRGDALGIVAVTAGDACQAAAFQSHLQPGGPLLVALASAAGLAPGELLRVRLGHAMPAGQWPLEVVRADIDDRDARSAIVVAEDPVAQLGVQGVEVRVVPNPFNPATTVHFVVAAPGAAAVPTRVAVHDLAGRMVRVLVDRPLAPGTHDVTWDGRDDGGRPVGSGVYVCRITSGIHSVNRKMTLLR